MVSKPLRWRRAEMKRGIGALNAAGKQLKSVVIHRDGSFELVVDDNPKSDSSEQINDLDKWMEKHHANDAEGD